VATQKSKLPEIKNQFIKDWLKFTDGSEVPELFNMWTGLSAVAACLGRRSSLNTGRFRVYPNMYVVLTGPAAVRKSSAAGIVSKLLKQYTGVKFGPTDTAGRRQGLITAFMEAYGTKPKTTKTKITDDLAKIFADSEEQERKLDAVKAINARTDIDVAEASVLERMLMSTKSITDITPKYKHPPNSNVDHDLFLFADELSDLIGMNQPEMINFLTSIYYPQDNYEYKLVNSSAKINRPGLNILSCTTPTSLMKHLPETAIGQGFSSRAMFVYCGQPRPKVFRPPPLDEYTAQQMGNLFATLSKWNVEFTLDEGAFQAQESIYLGFRADIKDTRFAHYEQRRDMHMSKVLMLLAAARNSTVISYEDVVDAQLIMLETERDMHLSLGELGINKISIAKQHMRDLIEAAWPDTVSIEMLRSNAMRDMTTKQQFQETLEDLIARGVCRFVTSTTSGKSTSCVIAINPEMLAEKARACSRDSVKMNIASYKKE
jgi:Protein of unknown function (DUF3987)